MPTLRVPVGGNGHRSIQRPIQTRSDGRCPDVRKKISQSVSHKSEPHPEAVYLWRDCLQSGDRMYRGNLIAFEECGDMFTHPDNRFTRVDGR